MNRKNLLKYILGFSVIVSISNSVLKNRIKRKKSPSVEDPLAPFVGKWIMKEPGSLAEVHLTISDDGQFYLNGHSLQGKVTLIGEDQLIFTDHYGYELVLKKVQDQSYNLYDEADDKEYELIPDDQ